MSDIWGMIRRMNGVKRNTSIPVLISDNKTAVSNIEKAELLAETLVKIHSSENFSARVRQCRDNTLAQNPDVNVKKATSRESLDLPFNLFELKRALLNV